MVGRGGDYWRICFIGYGFVICVMQTKLHSLWRMMRSLTFDRSTSYESLAEIISYRWRGVEMWKAEATKEGGLDVLPPLALKQPLAGPPRQNTEVKVSRKYVWFFIPSKCFELRSIILFEYRPSFEFFLLLLGSNLFVFKCSRSFKRIFPIPERNGRESQLVTLTAPHANLCGGLCAVPVMISREWFIHNSADAFIPLSHENFINSSYDGIIEHLEISAVRKRNSRFYGVCLTPFVPFVLIFPRAWLSFDIFFVVWST